MQLKTGDRVRITDDLGYLPRDVGIVTKVYGSMTCDVHFESAGRSVRCLFDELERIPMGMDENGNPIDYRGFFRSNPDASQIMDAARHTSDSKYFEPYAAAVEPSARTGWVRRLRGILTGVAAVAVGALLVLSGMCLMNLF